MNAKIKHCVVMLFLAGLIAFCAGGCAMVETAAKSSDTEFLNEGMTARGLDVAAKYDPDGKTNVTAKGSDKTPAEVVVVEGTRTTSKNDIAAVDIFKYGWVSTAGATVASQTDTSINKKGEVVAGGTTRSSWDDTFDTWKTWGLVLIAWAILPPLLSILLPVFWPASAAWAGSLSKFGLISIVGWIFGLFKKKDDPTIVEQIVEKVADAAGVSDVEKDK